MICFGMEQIFLCSVLSEGAKHPGDVCSAPTGAKRRPFELSTADNANKGGIYGADTSQ